MKASLLTIVFRFVVVSLSLSSFIACAGGGGGGSDQNSQEQSIAESDGGNDAQLSAGSFAMRVMPLGDSITESRVGYSSYRAWLWFLLAENGFNVDFVGSNRGVYFGSPVIEGFDQDHEGHWGWRTDEILYFLNDWAAAFLPDIVLLHLGTNDLLQGESIPGIIDELATVIDTLRAHNPNVDIIIAQLIPNDEVYGATELLNGAIPGLAAGKDSKQSRVIVADQWSGFSVFQHTFDGIHPNEAGEQLMAGVWFNHLSELLLQ